MTRRIILSSTFFCYKVVLNFFLLLYVCIYRHRVILYNRMCQNRISFLLWHVFLVTIDLIGSNWIILVWFSFHTRAILNGWISVLSENFTQNKNKLVRIIAIIPNKHDFNYGMLLWSIQKMFDPHENFNSKLRWFFFEKKNPFPNSMMYLKIGFNFNEGPF